MFNYLASENLKFKRTFSRKLIVLAPLFFILYAFLTQYGMGVHNDDFLLMVFNWWPLVAVPVGSALLCSLSDAKERKAGNYRSLRSRPVHGKAIWFSKIAVIAYQLLLSSVILAAVVLLTGLLLPDTSAPLLEVCQASMAVWAASICLIPVYLFLAAWLGTAAAIGASIAGLIAGVVMAAEAGWTLMPWSWPLRLMCPIVGVHPNGTPLPLHDPLRSAAVIPAGLAGSLLLFAGASWLTAVWFSRREG